MARSKREASLETRTARARLRPRKAPYSTTLEKGRGLSYYKSLAGTAGSWIARFHNPETHKHRTQRIGAADDLADADGEVVLSYAQAQAKAREWFAQVHLEATGRPTSRKPFTVLDAWELYRQKLTRQQSKGISRMEVVVKAHILPHLGHLEVSKLTQERIERWHEDLANTAARRRTKRSAKNQAVAPAPVSDDDKRKRRASANRVLTILKSALNHAKQQRRVNCPADTWREVKPFKRVDLARSRYLTVDEQIRFLNACPGDFRRLVQGALYTGARYGELIRLQVEDYNPVSQTILLRETKGGRPRHITLTEEGDAFFKAQVVGLKGDALVFTREAYEGMRRVSPGTQTPLSKVVRGWKIGDQHRPMREVCESLGMKPFGFHQLRHSYASALVNLGVPLAFVADQLGHTDTRMVEKHYGHLDQSAKAKAIRLLAPKLGFTPNGHVESLKISGLQVT